MRFATALFVAAALAACSNTTSVPDDTGLAIGIASTATVVAGASTTVGVTIDKTSPFSGAVALSISDLPAGVTATFSPTSVPDGAGSILTLAASAGATPGTYNITVDATGGGYVAPTITVALTVIGTATPAASISVTPPAISIAQGGNGATTVTLVRSGGYSDPVTLTVTGLRTGISAAFSPAVLEGAVTSSALTFTVTSSAATGVANMTITATGPGIPTATTPMVVTVTNTAVE